MNSTASRPRLQGWKEIAAYLDTSARTAQRWETDLRLPVHRESRIHRSVVYALAEELEAWQAAHQREIEEDRKRAASSAASPHTPSPAPDRVRRTGLLLGTAAAVLVLAVLAWVIGSPFHDRQREQPSPSSDEPSRPAAYSLPVGGTVLVLTIRVGNDVATAETMSGTTATVTLPSGRKLGVVPMAREHGLELAVGELARREGGFEALRERARQPLALAQAVMIDEPDQASVEVTDTRAAPASTGGAHPPRAGATCCVTCGQLTVCALRVQTSCGRCDATR